MVHLILGNGFIVKGLAKEFKLGKTIFNMKEPGLKICLMDSESILLRMIFIMRVNGLMVRQMEKENYILQKHILKEIGKMIYLMAQD